MRKWEKREKEKREKRRERRERRERKRERERERERERLGKFEVGDFSEESGAEIRGEWRSRRVFDSLLSAVENEKAGIFAVGRWMPRNQFLGEGVVVEIQFGHAGFLKRESN